jgi:hypothetical protein
MVLNFFHKLYYFHSQCNLFFSLVHVHNRFQPYKVIIRCSFAKNSFTVWYISLLPSHRNAIHPNLKLWTLLKSIEINQI